ncbi:MAG TPA: D-amino-acid transaminase [Nitrospira sp.]|nr:D-amino-acid transaminase [Nitrospira sp.]
MAFVNGRFLPFADAVVSIDDRGFQFGDGVYEVIRTYHGRPFEVDAHLVRLDRSAMALGIVQPYPHARWRDLIEEGIRRAAFPEAKVYMQITRGAAPRDHAYGADLVPTTVMTVRELRPLSPVMRASGVETITTEDLRWGRCDIKSLNLLPNVLARQRGKQAGAFEAIFVKDGMVTEGASSNVIVVSHGTLRTAPEGPQILSGVTRSVVLQLARAAQLSVDERPASRSELHQAEEVFLTGTTVEVLGVTKIDGKIIGTGTPGSLTRQLTDLFLKRTG